MKHPVILVMLLVSAALFSGCASIFRGSSEKLIIQSNPSGAEVRLSTGQSGITPYEVEVKRKDTIFIAITKNGYKPLDTAVISSIDGGSLGVGTVANVLFLPIVNDIVDYKTGANYSHKPNPLIVTLIPLSSGDEYKLTAPPQATANTKTPAEVPNKAPNEAPKAN